MLLVSPCPTLGVLSCIWVSPGEVSSLPWGQKGGVVGCYIFVSLGLSNERECHEGTAQRQREQNAWKGTFLFFPVLPWAAHAACSEMAYGVPSGPPGVRGKRAWTFFIMRRLNACCQNSHLHTLSHFITREKILKEGKAI